MFYPSICIISTMNLEKEKKKQFDNIYHKGIIIESSLNKKGLSIQGVETFKLIKDYRYVQKQENEVRCRNKRKR